MCRLQIDAARFERARSDAEKRSRESIGTLGEKVLHATLKNYFSDAGDLQEQKIGRYVADIFGKRGIIEIQTGGYAALKKRLPSLLEQYPVTVVCPVMRKKELFWIDPVTGAVDKGRRSPKTGRLCDALPELFYLSEFCERENFKIWIFLYDGREYKIRDGWGNGGKRGAHRADRVPLTPVDLYEFSVSDDFAALLPPGCPDSFTGEQFSGLISKKGYKLWASLRFLTERGVLRREKRNRTYVYTVG